MDEQDVVVKQQDQISVFHNADGGITIKQKCWPDEDQVVSVNLEGAEILAKAIMDCRAKAMRGD